jgi:TatD DNase family protein
MFIYTDSHAHLSSVAEELGTDALRELLDEYGEAASSAERAGTVPPVLVDIGTEPDDLDARAALLGSAARSSFLRLTAGVWPSAERLASGPASLSALEAAIAAAGRAGLRVAAIGEGGLDYYHMNGPREAQAELFEGQLDLARRLGLPMIVHSREAFADTLAALESAALGRGRPEAAAVIIHCFGYGPDEARAFLDAGCFLSFAGNLTYKGAAALREACAQVPLDRLLLETDAPYMNPMPLRGRPSSPRDIERTYAAAASLRCAPVEELAQSVSRSARALFG